MSFPPVGHPFILYNRALDIDTFTVRHIPSWFPGAKFRRIGEAGTELARQVRFDGYDLVKKTIVSVSLKLILILNPHFLYRRQEKLIIQSFRRILIKLANPMTIYVMPPHPCTQASCSV